MKMTLKQKFHNDVLNVGIRSVIASVPAHTALLHYGTVASPRYLVTYTIKYSI